MTRNLHLLINIEEHFTPVLMPDGLAVDSHEKDTMRIAIPANEEGTDFHVIPLLNTPLVPGLYSHLVSIPAQNMSGILAKFDTTHAHLTINGKDIIMNNPHCQRSQSQGLLYAINLESSLPAMSPTVRGKAKIMVPLQLMHRRMGC